MSHQFPDSAHAGSLEAQCRAWTLTVTLTPRDKTELVSMDAWGLGNAQGGAAQAEGLGGRERGGKE